MRKMNFLIMIGTLSILCINCDDTMKEEQPILLKLPSCLLSMKKLNDTYSLELILAEKLIDIYEDLAERKKLEPSFAEADDQIKSYAKSIVKRHQMEFQSNSTFTHHPINVLHLVKRIVNDFNPLLDIMDEHSVRNRAFKEIKRILLNQVAENGCWLIRTDVDNALTHLAKLWTTYQPPLKDFFNGDIFGFKSVDAFSWEELQSILLYLYEEEYHEDLVKIIEFTLHEKLDLVRQEDGLQNRLIKMKAYSLRKLNQFDDAIKTLQELNKNQNDPNIKRAIDNIQEKKDSKKNWELTDLQLKEEDFKRICRGHYSNPILDCQFFCPLRGWFCFKEEIMKRKPLIKLLHDTLNQEDIDQIIDKSNARLHLGGPISSSSEFGISASALLKSYNSCLEKLDEKIPLILQNHNTVISSKLSQTPSLKYYHVLNYGFTDVYSLSDNDTFVPQVLPRTSFHTTNRIATWISFLSSPGHGGGIAFIKEKLLVPTIKGASLVWFSKYKNGKRVSDIRSKTCPIMIGEKWVAKRWVKEDTGKYIGKCKVRPKMNE